MDGAELGTDEATRRLRARFDHTQPPPPSPPIGGQPVPSSPAASCDDATLSTPPLDPTKAAVSAAAVTAIIACPADGRGFDAAAQAASSQVATSDCSLLIAEMMPQVVRHMPVVAWPPWHDFVTTPWVQRLLFAVLAVGVGASWSMALTPFPAAQSAGMYASGCLMIVASVGMVSAYDRQILRLVAFSFDFIITTVQFWSLEVAIAYFAFGLSAGVPETTWLLVCSAVCMPLLFAIDASPFAQRTKAVASVFMVCFFVLAYVLMRFFLWVFPAAVASSMATQVQVSIFATDARSLWMSSCATLALFFCKYSVNALRGKQFIVLTSHLARVPAVEVSLSLPEVISSAAVGQQQVDNLHAVQKFTQST